MKITYEHNKWLQSQWQRDTRSYNLTLCQDIYGSWIITMTWGSAVNRGFGKSKDMDCPNYQEGLKTYYKLVQKREKRGYRRVDSETPLHLSNPLITNIDY